jgi:hypothetical protein
MLCICWAGLFSVMKYARRMKRHIHCAFILCTSFEYWVNENSIVYIKMASTASVNDIRVCVPIYITIHFLRQSKCLFSKSTEQIHCLDANIVDSLLRRQHSWFFVDKSTQWIPSWESDTLDSLLRSWQSWFLVEKLIKVIPYWEADIVDSMLRSWHR